MLNGDQRMLNFEIKTHSHIVFLHRATRSFFEVDCVEGVAQRRFTWYSLQ